MAVKKINILYAEDVRPSRDAFYVVGAFNPGVAVCDGETVLLVRVAEKAKNGEGVLNVPYYNSEKNETGIMTFNRGDPEYNFDDPRVVRGRKQNYLTSMSHLRLARSRDGVHFTVEPKPAITACDKLHAFGVEDARITQIGDTYYITYSSASPYGCVESLSVTKDFRFYEYKGVIFAPDNKDVVIFPSKVNGKFYALHRPSCSEYGRPEMWIAESGNLLHWGNHKHLASVREGMFDGGRLGASCVPFLTDKGWVEIYHGATKNNEYSLAVMLLDKNDPAKVLARSEKPLITPTENFEKQGFFSNVVFSCGCAVRGADVDIYYGAADNAVGLARLTLRDIYANLGL